MLGYNLRLLSKESCSETLAWWMKKEGPGKGWKTYSIMCFQGWKPDGSCLCTLTGARITHSYGGVEWGRGIRNTDTCYVDSSYHHHHVSEVTSIWSYSKPWLASQLLRDLSKMHNSHLYLQIFDCRKSRVHWRSLDVSSILEDSNAVGSWRNIGISSNISRRKDQDLAPHALGELG